jgi:hypothetical protein
MIIIVNGIPSQDIHLVARFALDSQSPDRLAILLVHDSRSLHDYDGKSYISVGARSGQLPNSHILTVALRGVDFPRARFCLGNMTSLPRQPKLGTCEAIALQFYVSSYTVHMDVLHGLYSTYWTGWSVGNLILSIRQSYTTRVVKRHHGQLRTLHQLTKPPRCVSCECDNSLSAYYHQHQKHSFPFRSISIPKPSPIQQDLQTRYTVQRRRTTFNHPLFQFGPRTILYSVPSLTH